MSLRRIVLTLLATSLVLAACGDDDDSDGTSSVELPAGAAEVVDEYYETVGIEHDGDAMLDLVTDEFEFVADEGVLDRAGWVTQVNAFSVNLRVERVGDRVASGEGAEYLVAQPERLVGVGVDAAFAMSVMRVVDVDGTWLIDMHQNLTIE